MCLVVLIDSPGVSGASFILELKYKTSFPTGKNSVFINVSSDRMYAILYILPGVISYAHL